MKKIKIELDDFSITGVSRSAYETYIKFNEFDCAFDIGKSAEAIINKNHIFISHVHLDHCAGLVHNLASRKLQRLSKINVYVPPTALENLRSIISLWEKIQNIKFNYKLIPLENNKEYNINKIHYVRSFPVFHRLETFGFELYEKRRKLKDEYIGLKPEKIIELKNNNIDIFYTLKVNKCIYTSDTTIKVFEKYPEILNSNVLIAECTFLFDEHLKIASNFEHIHFNEILPYIKKFKGKYFILCHFSMRYSKEEITNFFNEKKEEIPELEKIILLL